MSFFVKVCRREWLTKIRQPRDMLFAILFFVMICLFFPLMLPNNAVMLPMIAPGVVWLGVVLAMMLSITQVWQQDFDKGIFTQWYLSQQPLQQIIQAKILLHWLFCLVPVLCVLPLISVTYGLSLWENIVLVMSLLTGSLVVTYLTALASVFSLSVNQKGAIMLLIILPLALPIMIFGCGMVHIAGQGVPVLPYVSLFLAADILCLMLFPITIAAIIKIHVSECE